MNNSKSYIETLGEIKYNTELRKSVNYLKKLDFKLPKKFGKKIEKNL